MREVLDVIGCHVGETTGEYFVFEDDLLFGSFVSVVDDDFNDGWLLGILLSQNSLMLCYYYIYIYIYILHAI